jgi:hypothetical protein
MRMCPLSVVRTTATRLRFAGSIAEHLGVDEDCLGDVANEMDIEDAPSGSMASEKTASRRSPTSESKT